MAQRIGMRRHREHIPGIHQLIGEHARAEARKPDTRLTLMTAAELAELLASDPQGRYAEQIRILRLDGDPDWVTEVEEISAAVRQDISDAQPRAKSLDALADRVDAREPVTVQPTRVLDVLAARAVIRIPCGVSDYNSVGAPEWLVDLARPPAHLAEDRPGVTLSADDWTAAAPLDVQPAW
jgi:hypothetical protein